MARPLLARIRRGLQWALFGRPARRGVGQLTRPRRLFLEATITTSPVHRSSTGELVSWARLDLVEHEYGILGRVGFELAELQRGAEDRDVAYRTLRTIVRGAELVVETAHGESLTLREGTFTCVPRERRARPLRKLPPELGGAWPGAEPDRPLVREAVLRKGDLVRFEAVFTPERHARAGGSYRDEVEIRYRVDAGRDPIEIVLVAAGDR